ncbi:alpha/beta fold hydrolase [Kitasatospora sp. NPDC057936]|uniref:alpha/beta fold hydrolase n=1 Tax=Kitasatospora sp. NPDC057936 TaxID=3346283 RepID=UPI0036DCEB13
MIAAHETFDGTFPYRPHFSTAPGFRMHHVDEGDGPVLLCLHGEPTWGYLFRDLVRRFAPTHRVVVPDHMGFGKSETPAGRTYRLQDHVDNLVALVDDLGLRELTLVLHDFGGPVGMGLAARRPGLVAGVVSLNGPTPFGRPRLPDALMANAAESPWFRWIARAHADGSLDAVLGELGYTILSTLKLNGFENNALITDTWLRAYASPFPTRAEAAGALGWAKGFATGAHVFETPGDEARAALAAVPALAVWGGADRTLGARHFLPLFAEAFPRGRTVEPAGVGHYSPEDAPDTIAALLREFLSTAGRRRGLSPAARAPRPARSGTGARAVAATGGRRCARAVRCPPRAGPPRRGRRPAPSARAAGPRGPRPPAWPSGSASTRSGTRARRGTPGSRAAGSAHRTRRIRRPTSSDDHRPGSVAPTAWRPEGVDPRHHASFLVQFDRGLGLLGPPGPAATGTGLNLGHMPSFRSGGPR